MQARSPTGSPIVGTADMIPGNALISYFERLPDGTLGIEWVGETKVCWNGQQTKRTTDDYDPELVKALKGARIMLYAWRKDRASSKVSVTIPELRDTIAEIEEVLAKATAPSQDIYVDEDGREWPEDQLTLVMDEETVP